MVEFILSGVFPGLGQFYNRQPFKGVAFLVVGLVLSWLVARSMPADPLALVEPGRELIASILLLLMIWLWSLIDAWRAAGRATTGNASR